MYLYCIGRSLAQESFGLSGIQILILLVNFLHFEVTYWLSRNIEKCLDVEVFTHVSFVCDRSLITFVKNSSVRYVMCNIIEMLMSQWVKILVSQLGIELWSLAFQASIITARPPRHGYIHPSKEKVCPHASHF